MSATNPPYPYNPNIYNPSSYSGSTANTAVTEQYILENCLTYPFAQGLENTVGIINLGDFTSTGASSLTCSASQEIVFGVPNVPIITIASSGATISNAVLTGTATAPTISGIPTNTLEIINYEYLTTGLGGYITQSEAAATYETILAASSTYETITAASNTYQTISNMSYYAPVANPNLTGTPTAPTATAGTNTTQLATTAFVVSSTSGLAPLASPNLTGVPTAPTATAGTNTTQLATTAFCLANGGSGTGYAPIVNPVFTQSITVDSDIKAYGGLNNYNGTGTYLWNSNNTQYTSITQAVGGLNFVGAANGTTTMGDGVHLMNLNVPFGSITCSTPPAGTNSTIVATTAFVNNASGYSGQIPIQWAGSQQNSNSSYDLIYYGQATTGSLNTLYGIPITANSSNCIITATVSNSVCGATLMSGVQYIQFVYGSTMGSQVNNPNNNYPQITFNYDVAVHQQITSGISLPAGYINYTIRYIG